jgi:hypothetical protein
MKNTLVRCAFFAALACGLSIPASAGDLKLSMKDGRVTVIGDNVPLRQILQEWARVGRTTIVNGEKLSGPAISIQLVDVPEKTALDILLRSAAGYIAAPRAAVLADAAYYDRITILATSRAPAASASVAPPPPVFQRAPVVVDDDEPINVATPQPVNPVTSQFPGQLPQQNQPGTATQPGPITAPRPGALPPQPPNGPFNPYQPVVPTRPPGGPGGPGGRGGGPGIDGGPGVE